MAKRVLVFEPHGFGVPVLEMALDAIQDHLDAGDRVDWIGCDKELLACESNLFHSASMCAKCVSRRRNGAALLSPRVAMTSLLNYVTAEHRKELLGLKTHFQDLEELKAYAVDNLDLGEAVISTLVSCLREPDLDVTHYADVIKRLVLSTFLVYRAIQNYLDREPTDLVCISNGRLAIFRAALRACESRRVNFLVKDGGRDTNHLSLFENRPWFDLKPMLGCINDAWEAGGNDPRRLEVASGFFRSRASGGRLADFPSFVAQQQAGLLPVTWDNRHHNVVIFNSSEEEFIALGPEWRNPLYRNQLEGLQRLHRDLPQLREDVHFTLRIHPNFRGLHEKYLAPLLALAGPRFTVITPDDTVSSYALLQAADTVLSFGSTMGIEAVFWGKPSILVGRCLYQDLGGTYNPASHAELLELVQKPLAPRDKEAALKFAYYQATLGVPYKFCKFEAPDKARFKGRYVRWSRATHYFWALVHRLVPLNKMIDRQFLRRTFQKIMNGAPPR